MRVENVLSLLAVFTHVACATGGEKGRGNEGGKRERKWGKVGYDTEKEMEDEAGRK